MLLGKKCTKGFTLVELIVVIAIMGILAAVAVPAYDGYVKKLKEKVCKANCMQVERVYEAYLIGENVEHTDVVFEEFLKEYGEKLCPENGEINYVDGKVKCSVHGEDVPFL